MKWAQCGGWVFVFWLLAWPVGAQDAGDSASAEGAARASFERGKEAFDAASYEEALNWFWEAYNQSKRGELHYNIGLAANRLQRDEEALEAFRRYLNETDEPGRRLEVERRVAALERSIAVRQASEAALEDAESRYEQLVADGAAEQAAAERRRRGALLGGSLLIVAGAVGVGAMTWGLVKDGSCDERAGESQACVGEASTTGWSWVYGGLGAAAMVGGLTWMVVGGKRVESREVALGIAPEGLRLRGSF